jgi:hypothetical protein
MADTTVYDETVDGTADPELADLVAAAACIDLRPLDARRACDVLNHVPHESRFPKQRRHPGPSLSDGTIVVPDAAVATLDGWD